MKNPTLEHEIKNLYEEIKALNTSTHRLYDTHKVNVEKNPKNINSRKKNIINFMELDNRSTLSYEYFKKVAELDVKLAIEQKECKKNFAKLSVLYERITERINILKEISMLIKDTETSLDNIEYQMNVKFGNEFFWKKEFTKEFLNDFRLYVKNPTVIRKDNILRSLSILSTGSIRGSKNSEGENFASYDALKAELDSADKELEVIRDLTGFIFMMKAELEQISSRTSII